VVAAPPDPRVWLAAAFLAWSVLALFLASGLVRSWLRLRRLLADRRPIEAGPAHMMLARLSAGSRLRRVRLSASVRVDVPIAVGVLRPEIVVPERALYELEPAELESLLAHELAHLVRRDPAWRLVAGSVHRILFLQPLNRVAILQLESASEILCDDWAVERTLRPLALARCLTEVAGWVASSLGASVPAMARRGSGLGRRVRRLVAAGDGVSPRRRDRWPLPLAAGGLALVTFAAPGATDTSSLRPPSALPPPAMTFASASDPDSGQEEPADRDAPAAPSPPRDADRAEARRLLDELRSGRVGDHDLSDWVSLAQLLGSPDRAGLGQPPSAGDDAAASSAASLFSGEDLEGLEGLIEGAVSQVVGSILDLGLDLDIDVDPAEGIDIHIDGLPGGDGDSGFELNLDLGAPDVDVDVPDVPGPPDPPDPPDLDCDHDRDCHRDHHPVSEAALELRRRAREQGRIAREQGRIAREQGRIARDEALRHARRVREEAIRKARRAYAEGMRHARQAREQALRQAREARRQARDAHEQARRVREQIEEQLRSHERAMREAERARQHQESRRALEERRREREQRDREQRERERESRDQL
jgi:hypothetical protein